MNNLSWLFDRRADNRQAGAQQEPMVAIPLPQHKMQDLQAPVTPQVKQMFEMIDQHRTKNPAYIPFAPGTPTFTREQFDEGTRRWGQEFDEGKKRWGAEFDEGKRRYEESKQQWEREFAEGIRRFNANKSASSAPKAPTSTQIKNASLNNLTFDIDELKGGGYSKDDAIRYVQHKYFDTNNSDNYLGDTISYFDVVKLVESVYEDRQGEDDIMNIIGGGESSADNMYRDILRSRPLWQKVIDGVLPGAQYRPKK